MDEIARTLSLLKSEELYPVWSSVDRMERLGEISAAEAARWKHGIYGLMELWELEPVDLISAVLM